MINQPLVSILIPTYNRDVLLLRAVKSVITQVYPNIEVIICDNCSTDQTEVIITELMKIDSRVSYFKNESNIGPVGNWIKCINHARGEYAYLLFSDDYLADDCIQKHINILHHDSQLAFTYSNLYGVNVDRVDYENTPVGKYESEKFLIGQILPEESSTSPGLPLDYPVTPACALFRLKDLRDNLRISLPNILNFDFSLKNHSGMGNDKCCFFLTALKYPSVYHINEVLAFSGPDGRNLSTLFGGQENYFHFLAIQSCLAFDVQYQLRPAMEKAWKKRIADFIAYLVINNLWSGIKISIKELRSFIDLKVVINIVGFILKCSWMKYRYKFGVYRKKLIK